MYIIVGVIAILYTVWCYLSYINIHKDTGFSQSDIQETLEEWERGGHLLEFEEYIKHRIRLGFLQPSTILRPKFLISFIASLALGLSVVVCGFIFYQQRVLWYPLTPIGKGLILSRFKMKHILPNNLREFLRTKLNL